MKTALEERDAVLRDEVHESVFCGDSTGPATGKLEREGLRLSDSREGIAHCGLDEVQTGSLGPLANPVAQNLAEVRVP